MVPRDQSLDSSFLTQLMTVRENHRVVLGPLVLISFAYLELAKLLVIDIGPHLHIGTWSGHLRCAHHCLQGVRSTIPGIKL